MGARRFCAILSLLILIVPVAAGEEDKLRFEKLGVARYQSDRVDFGKAVLKALLKHRWTIDKVEKNRISAQYRRKAGIEFRLREDGDVEMRELPVPPGVEESWWRNLKIAVIRNIEYHYYVRIVESL